eukprot:TRINITY_DN64608_c0_g1_i1.p1 TRINITY_DN64608_c0_g1~~TRINITY_DN64608_c0_g1_i1.p1  ORF type:complete len:100 (-),score=28.05 TRINITY_DN64608_c0_g1_i1:74-373(-)
MLRSLVGSEMCIRDSGTSMSGHRHRSLTRLNRSPDLGRAENPGAGMSALWMCWSQRSWRQRYHPTLRGPRHICLLYTSDAADEEDSVDLGGRRIIKKKK